jgi:hypothetical protein
VHGQARSAGSDVGVAWGPQHVLEQFVHLGFQVVGPE